MLFLKLSSTGDFEWGKSFGSSYSEECHAVKQSNDGGYILVGFSSTGSGVGEQLYEMKLDASGNIEWNFEVGGSYNERGYDVIQDTDNGFVFIGETNDIIGAGYRDVNIQKRDFSGNYLWGWIFGQSGNEVGYSIIKDTDGGYAIAGYTDSFGSGGTDMYYAKLNPDGTPDYSIAIGGSQDDEAKDLTLSHDGGYVIAGYTISFGAGYGDYFIRKLDSEGDPVWASVIGGSEHEVGHSIIRTIDNGFAIVGETKSFGAGAKDLWLVKLDTSGSFEWSWAFGGNEDDVGYSIVQDEDGFYYASGYTRNYGVGNYDTFIVKFAPDGGTCLGQYYGLPGSGKMSGLENNGFIDSKINSVQFSRITGDMTPAPMKFISGIDLKIKKPGSSKDNITPTVTIICE